MYLKELEYIDMLATEGSLSRAAEKLFITPSALNQQLEKLETSIGIPLFHRSRNGWTLTQAGEIYTKNARRILQIRHETYKQLQDLAGIQKGTLTIGLPEDRGGDLFTQVYGRFHQEYPQIQLQIIEKSVRDQQKMLAEGRIDIGFMTLTESQKTDDIYKRLYSEGFYLVLAKNYAHLLEIENETEVDLEMFRDFPFALIYKNSTARALIDEGFHHAGFAPRTLFESSRFRTILNVAASGMCVGIITAHYATPRLPELCYFKIRKAPSWGLYAAYKRGAYLTDAGKRLIELITDTNPNKDSDV